MNRRIGIVILNYQTFAETERVVKELLSQECSHDMFIVVVDNASPNNSYEYLQSALGNYANVLVYKNGENSGYAKGNNVGLCLLAPKEPEYVLVVNNDVHFNVSVFDKLIEAYERVDDAGAISPLQYYGTGELNRARLDIPSFWEDMFDYTFLLSRLTSSSLDFKENTPYKDVFKVGRNHGSFILMDYKLFSELGFFTEDTFLFCEERFLARKLLDAGKSCYMHLGCSYIHDHSRTISNEVAFLRQLRLLHEGRLAYTRRYRKYPELKSMLLSLMWAYQYARVRISSYVRALFKRNS